MTEFFKFCRKECLNLKLFKWSFKTENIVFLVCEYEHGKVCPDNVNIYAIKKSKLSKNVKELQHVRHLSQMHS